MIGNNKAEIKWLSRQLELETVKKMIGIYCHELHHSEKNQLCPSVQPYWNMPRNV